MSKLAKPSRPVVKGANVSVNAVPGATRYNLYKIRYFIPKGYVSLGDSIAAGHAINSGWEANYGTGSQYGNNNNVSTVIVPGSYTDLIRTELIGMYGGEAMVDAKSFAQSGDRVDDLIDKLSRTPVADAIKDASIVTICIGANDILGPALDQIESYISRGNPALEELAVIVEANLSVLNDDGNENSYRALFDKLNAINPNAKYIFTTIYNPYKYLYLVEGYNGFFKPVLDAIPNMDILGFDVDKIIKDNLLSTDIIKMMFDRVNRIGNWAETYINKLNQIIKNKISEYQSVNSNFTVTDTKLMYDSVPDRPVSASKHYNDLVNVEFTRGYTTGTMDWGALWRGDDPANYWFDLAGKYVSWSGVDINGLANDLVSQTVEKVIVPNIDPHPEEYGHYVLKRAFADTLGWQSVRRYSITYNANGGSGSMAVQWAAGIDSIPAFVNINVNSFTRDGGYYFTGWNTAADGSGTSYSNGGLINLTSDITLYAQWSNMFTVTYRHTNATNLYGNDETGHMECYALYINGELKPKFGTFASGSSTTYYVPYGSTIRVVVGNYNPTELMYDDTDCSVYWNGAQVSNGYRGTEYTFTLTTGLDIDFRWKIAGSLVTFNARSWEDCYITTV